MKSPGFFDAAGVVRFDEEHMSCHDRQKAFKGRGRNQLFANELKCRANKKSHEKPRDRSMAKIFYGSKFI